MFKMGYEIFSNCAKLSSVLVPRIKSHHSLSSKSLTVLIQSLVSLPPFLTNKLDYVSNVKFQKGRILQDKKVSTF